MASLSKRVCIFVGRTVKCKLLNSRIHAYCPASLCNSLRNYCDKSFEYTNAKDPAPLFFSDDVQQLLKKLTRVNLERVFRHRCLEDKKLETPVYKFMTDDELKASLEEAEERANDMLQMPPVVKVREAVTETLSRDPALQRYDTCNYVFTDISFGLSNRERLILVRDASGTLSKADADTRHRINQIYFPQPGRELNTPRMFHPEHLINLFARKEYEFILDRACVQFDPDDPEYHRVTSLTYQTVSRNGHFDALRSTRHFGPLVFYLTWTEEIDELLLELIESRQVSEANSLIRLRDRVHEEDQVGRELQLTSEEDDTRLVEKYVREKSRRRGQLELALQSYKEWLKRKGDLEEGIRRAHGIA